MKKRRVVPLFERDEQELDRMVLEELEILERQAKWDGQKRPRDASSNDSAGIQEKRKAPQNERSPDQLKVVPRAIRATEDEDDDFATSPLLEVELTGESDELFDSNEEKFIAASVSYLQTRNNKDAIIARIWNRLTEAEPDSFYSPESDGVSLADNAVQYEPEPEKREAAGESPGSESP